MPKTTEAFSRVKIDVRLRDVGWTLEDGIAFTLDTCSATAPGIRSASSRRSGRARCRPRRSATQSFSTFLTSFSSIATKSGFESGYAKRIAGRSRRYLVKWTWSASSGDADPAKGTALPKNGAMPIKEPRRPERGGADDEARGRSTKSNVRAPRWWLSVELH